MLRNGYLRVFYNCKFVYMKTIVNTPAAPMPIGPYNQSVVIGQLVFISGQIAIDPSTDELVLDNIEAETHQVLKNLKAILEATGSSLEKVAKVTVFVKDMNMFGRINAVYAEYFQAEFAPARELVQVSELPKFVNIEISAIAHTA
jgi:2-iminobutanoate/2-iminopropanoate deaminase